MILLLFVAGILNVPRPTIDCKVTAEYVLAPGLSSPFTGIAFRYIYIVGSGSDCGLLKIRLANYGGMFPGEPINFKVGDKLILGPVPIYRTVERVLPNGKVFNILLKRRSP